MSKNKNGAPSVSPCQGDPARASDGRAGQALLDEVHATMRTLAGLLDHEQGLGAEAVGAIRATLAEADERLGRKALTVVLIGEHESGKSTLMDALIGERMLGRANTPPGLVASVRHAANCEYNATFANGNRESFSERAPDPRPRLELELAEAERALEDARSRQAAASEQVSKASEAVDATRGPLATAFRSFETACQEAAQAGEQQKKAERLGREAEEALQQAERAVPVFARKRPAWWAFWLWVARTVVLLFGRRRVRAHRDALSQHRTAIEQAARARQHASVLAERSTAMERELPVADAPVEAAKHALAAAVGEREEARAAVHKRELERNDRRLALETARRERSVRFRAEVQTLLDPQQRLPDLVRLDLELPTRLIPGDIIVMDAPGVVCHGNDDGSRERALNVIAREADAFVLVSELERAVSGKTMQTLQELRDIVPHAVLVLTKMDQSFAEANRKTKATPWEHVEQARRIGTRRFARKLGRDPSTVLSVAVAARSALDDSGTTETYRRQFDRVVERLFEAVRQERALILGARCTRIVRSCMGKIDEAAGLAERTYKERLSELLAKRTPGPDWFQAERMAACEASIVEAAASMVKGAASALAGPMQIAAGECTRIVMAAPSARVLRTLASEFDRVIAAGLAKSEEEVRDHIDREARRTLRPIEEEAFQALRQQYDLLHDVTDENDSPLRMATPHFGRDLLSPLPSFESRIRSFERGRLGLGIGGAAAGAALGTVLLLGVGSGVGALLGLSALFAWPTSALRRACAADIKVHVEALQSAMAERVKGTAPSIAKVLRDRLEQSIALVLVRFQRYISEPIEAERAAIQKERERLQDLQSLCFRLEQLDRNLDQRMQEAGNESLGLCRDRPTSG